MRYVIAVGGNALSKKEVLNKLSAQVVALYREGNEVVITHGNGPQVGRFALHEKKSLALLTEETQVSMGSEIKSSLLTAARHDGKISMKVVITHVLVDGNDKEFKKPTKPIGKFYSKAEANVLLRKGLIMKHLLEGYRRVVPSPKPIKILEIKKVENLVRNGNIVIAGGGGGIAMIKNGRKFKYADAVIDKDLTSALLAIKLNADRLFILTNVPGVFLNFETKRERMIKKVRVDELKRYIKEGCFEAGSMLPKVKACVEFANKMHKSAIIGGLETADKVFRLETATIILP
jgi:carbamate kinase